MTRVLEFQKNEKLNKPDASDFSKDHDDKRNFFVGRKDLRSGRSTEARSESAHTLVRVPPITFTRMFEPRHKILSNVRTNVRKYVVTWLERLRGSIMR